MKNNRTIYLLFSVIVLLATEKVFAQVIDVTKVTEEDKEWSEGAITLTSEFRPLTCQFPHLYFPTDQ